jgi:hypothetical protein
MLERDELKIAVEDARARQAALVQLLYFIDTQAMNFLRTYITIEAAAVSAIVAASASSWSFKPELIASAFGMLLTLITGSYFCFHTMRTVNITLPGRGPDFWLWGLDRAVPHDEVAIEYMNSLNETMQRNRQINEKSSKSLELAKLFGVLSPFVGLGGGLVAAACPSVRALF